MQYTGLVVALHLNSQNLDHQHRTKYLDTTVYEIIQGND